MHLQYTYITSLLSPFSPLTLPPSPPPHTPHTQGKLVLNSNTDVRSVPDKGARRYRFEVTCGETGTLLEILADDQRMKQNWMLAIKKVRGEGGRREGGGREGEREGGREGRDKGILMQGR